MNIGSFLRYISGFAFLLAISLPALAANPGLTEKAKIEYLITHIEGLKDATFVRNGSDYDPKSAAKFLRGKWQANEKEIKTAPDFIANAASVSSTTGKPYMIHFKKGKQVKCGEYLTGELKKLEAGTQEKP